MECNEVKKWCSPLIDGEVEAGRCEPIREHLALCQSCREEYQLLLEIKELVREKAPQERAPLHLRERVLKGLERERGRRAFAWRGKASLRSLSRSLPALSAAAVVLLLLGIAYYRLLEAPATPWGEGLVREHLQYAVVQSLQEQPTSNPQQLSSRLQGEVDFPLKVPDLREIELTLLGGRVLSLEGRRVAHLLYIKSGHKISLFVLKGDEMRLPLERVQQGGSTFLVGGYKEMALVFWRQGALSHLLICHGREKVASLMRCALLVQRRAGSRTSPPVGR